MIAGSQPNQFHLTARPTRRGKMSKLNVLLVTCFALVLASATRAQSNPGVNDAELKGDYAFTFNGMTTGGGGASTVFAAVGRFTADGAGNLTNGELDTNSAQPQQRATALTFTGTYAIGADHRGVMNVNITGGGTLAFAMMANGNAQFIEIDATGGIGEVGSGTMEKADTTAYNTAAIAGDYAFGFTGLDGFNDRTMLAGRFTANGLGAITDGTADSSRSGIFAGAQFAAGTYAVADSTTGRGMMSLPPLVAGLAQNLNFIFYVVNAGKLFAMEIDAVTSVTPLLNGSVMHQKMPLGGFSNASLNGGMVLSLTGQRVCSSGGSVAPNVLVGLLTGNGNGALSLDYDENCGGLDTTLTGLSGTYIVNGNGRVTIGVGASAANAYLVSSNQAFWVSSAFFGFADPQAAGTFTNASVMGRYAGYTSYAASLGTVIFSGEFTADGVIPTGTIIGTKDIGAPSGPSLGVPVSVPYYVSSTPTNGRGIIQGGSYIMYIVSPSKFVVITMNDANPAVLVFEQ